MQFEWDEAKRLANIEKHRIDFLDALVIWQRDVIAPYDNRMVDGESREVALGVIGDDAMVIAVIYTIRSGKVRIISARRARRYEREDYKSQFRCGL